MRVASSSERTRNGSSRALDAKLRRVFGRSLKLRVASAGDWDLGRFGIQYVASPVTPMD